MKINVKIGVDSSMADKELKTDLSQLKYVFFSPDDEHLVRADYEKAVATGAMLSGLQRGYADALSSSSE